jgi:DNA recombination protein RmuC
MFVMEIWLYILCVLAGGLLGVLFYYFLSSSKKGVSEKAFRALERENITLETQWKTLGEERDRLLKESQELNDQMVQNERASATFENEKKNLEEKLKTHREDLGKLQEQFKSQFENLANQIFEQKSKTFRENSEKNLSALINPLKEKITDFQKKVEETYSKESRDRFALQKEIEKIVQSSQQMTQETQNLTQALRGDVKAQGNWGEIVLERILEASGLRAGEEYTVQGKEMGLVDAEGKKSRPDVIVNLPEQKHIIIDSKVSLTHYERYISESNEEIKGTHLRDFLNSFYSHIDNLGSKSYQDLYKLETPDFVLMFVPIEGAFSLAIQSDPKIFTYAWDQMIVIVSPTTLLASLRTVSSLWKQERQNQNALEIARQGGLLYEKFIGFLGDLEKVGDYLNRSQNVYSDAMNKLKDGRGNILSKVENLKKLGAKTSKSLPTELLLSEDFDSENQEKTA